MAIKSKIAWAIVNKKNPKINTADLWADKKDVFLNDDETFIKVEIKPIKNGK